MLCCTATAAAGGDSVTDDAGKTNTVWDGVYIVLSAAIVAAGGGGIAAEGGWVAAEGAEFIAAAATGTAAATGAGGVAVAHCSVPC